MTKPIVLALGGGAALGWAHIGVIKALERHKVPIAGAAGTSIGAVVAVSYCAGRLDILEDLARSANLRRVIQFLDLSREPGGVLGGRVIERELERHLGGLVLDQLPLPCATVSVDMLSGEEVIARSGPATKAVRASLAIPGIFTPVRHEGRMLADGGLLNPVPVNAARLLTDAPVVAVNLQGDYSARAGMFLSAAKPSLFKVSRAAMGLLLAGLSAARLKVDPPDHVINPKVGHIDVGDFTKAADLIRIGEEAAEAALPNF